MKKCGLFLLMITFVYGLFFMPEQSLAWGENNYITMIKKSTLNADKSLAIGDALEGYQYAEKPSWNFYETKRHQKYVEFKCRIAPEKVYEAIYGGGRKYGWLFDQKSNSLRLFFKNGDFYKPDWEKLKKVFMENHLNYLLIRFSINKNEKDFEVNWIGITNGNRSVST